MRRHAHRVLLDESRLPGLRWSWVLIEPMFFPMSAASSEDGASWREERTRSRWLPWCHSNHNQRSCVVDRRLLSSAEY